MMIQHPFCRSGQLAALHDRPEVNIYRLLTRPHPARRTAARCVMHSALAPRASAIAPGPAFPQRGARHKVELQLRMHRHVTSNT
jgi:hypothetical protein